MSDLTIREAVDKAYSISKSKGFHDNPCDLGTRLMLITSELGEALEADRKGLHFVRNLKNPSIVREDIEKALENKDQVVFISTFKGHVKDTFEDEIADAFIRICDLAGVMNIDLAWHVEQKMNYNKTRERMHGKKY